MTPCSHDPAGDLLIAQTIAAHQDGHAVGPYLAARAAGATHEQITQATSPPYSIYIDSYAGARAGGATHAQTLAAHTAKVAASSYAALRQAGITHTEALEAYELGYCTSYIEARASDLTHADIIEACAAEYTITGYSRLRATGLSHGEIVHASTLPPPAQRLYMSTLAAQAST